MLNVRFYLMAAIATFCVGVVTFIFFQSNQTSAVWVEEAKLPLDPYENSVSSFAIKGNTAVYYTLQTPPNSQPQSVVNIYTVADNKWSQQAQLSIPNSQPFGYSNSSYTAIDGDTVLVGANVFTRLGETWSLSTQLQPPEQDTGIINSVAINGDTVVINTEKHTRVYRRNEDTGVWDFEAELHRKSRKSRNIFSGNRVAIDHNTIVLGNQVFRRSSTGNWFEFAELSLNGKEIPIIESVAVSGNIVVIGSPTNYVNDSTGSVYIFERNPQTGVWSYQAKLVPDDVPNFLMIYYGFGLGVAIDGNTLIIGVGVPKTNSPQWGWHPKRSVYVFVRNSRGGWSLQAKPKPKDYEQIADSYGTAVRISGNRIIVYGGPLNKTYVFRRVESKSEDVLKVRLLRLMFNGRVCLMATIATSILSARNNYDNLALSIWVTRKSVLGILSWQS